MADSAYMTPPAVAEYLGIDQRKILGWIARGELHAVNLSTGTQKPRWYIRRDDLDAFLAARASRPAPKPTRRPAPVDAGVVEYF